MKARMELCKDKIIGKRMFLKNLNPENFSVKYVEWMQDKDILRYLTGSKGGYSPEELKEYISNMNSSKTNQLFGIFLMDGDVHVGNIKIGNIDEEHRFADVGLLLGDKTIWGQGFATEAINLVTQYAFDQLDLNKLTAGMIEENEGSYKAFVKSGYRKVGVMQEHVLFEGKHVDIVLVEKCKNMINSSEQ